MYYVLVFLQLVTTGLYVGGLFVVNVAVVPTFATLSPDRYAETHQLLDRYSDPYMPILGFLATLTAIGELWFSHSWQIGYRLVGLAGLIAIIVISIRIHGPLNRHIRAWKPGSVDEQLTAVRARWIGGHRIRTVIAAICLVSLLLPAIIPA